MASLVFVIFVTSATAQQVIVAPPDPGIVDVGGEAIVRITAVGAGGAGATLMVPPVDGLDVAAGEARQLRAQIFTGDSLVEDELHEWEVSVTPRRAGTFELSPLVLDASGRALASTVQRLESVEGAVRPESCFLELKPARATVFVNEPVAVSLVIGIEEGFLAKNLIQLSRQRLDLPVRIAAAWLDDPEASLAVRALAAAAMAPGEGASLVVNEQPAQAVRVAERIVGGKHFRVFELTRTLVPLRSGELILPGAAMRLAFATRFEEDFLTGRTASDREEALLLARATSIEVQPLPAEGRPEGFRGAVGHFTLRAEAEPRNLRAGESLKLVVRIAGEGPATLGPAPDFGSLPGFHLYGQLDETLGGERTLTLDLAPLAPSVKEVPALAFSYFDPGDPPQYRVAKSAPIPLEVGGEALPAAAAPGGSVAGAAGLDDIHDLETWPGPPDGEPRASRASFGAALAAMLAPLAMAAAFAAWWRKRERDRQDPWRARTRRAARRFHAAVAGAASDPAGALDEFLATHLREPAPAMHDPRLGERLARRGFPADMAARAEAVHRGLVAARYGGAAAEAGAREAAVLVDALQESWREREQPR